MTLCLPVGEAARVSPRARCLYGQHGFSLIDLLAVVSLIAVISAMAIPMTGSAVAGHRFKGDAQALTNMVGLAKMRASASFTRARVRANLTTNTFVLERYNRDADVWVQEGGELRLSRGVSFGFASLTLPPPSTQTTIGMSPQCRTKTGTGSSDSAIPNTACIVFNSRGLPVDGNGVQYSRHALYLTDGGSVAGTTVTATPRIRRWLSPANTANWKEQQ